MAYFYIVKHAMYIVFSSLVCSSMLYLDLKYMTCFTYGKYLFFVASVSHKTSFPSSMLHFFSEQ